MSKSKRPLLSFEAKGSIGDALTFQKRGSATVIREKPIPSQPNTQPQAYQRWLYQDYVALWHALSSADQQTWKSAASRYHMTGFAYWMKSRLSTQPDIVGIWHLDEAGGAFAFDSSLNLNHGTIFGASPIDGLISRARYWDGLDDRIVIPHDPSLNFGTDNFTIELFANIPDVAANRYLIGKNFWANGSWLILIDMTRRIYTIFYDLAGGVRQTISVANSFPLKQDLHIALTVNQAGLCHLFIDAQEPAYFLQQSMAGLGLVDSMADLWIGYQPAPAQSKGMKDEVRIYRRILAAADILRHSLHRYPPYSV